MKNNKQIFIIDVLTNMHVGSGDTNYNIVDKEVQRDIVTNHPTINSSSLKGALREYFKYKNSSIVDYIFGSERNKGKSKSESGKYTFFNANLLFLPVRSNKKQFFYGTCPALIKDFKEELMMFQNNNNFFCEIDKYFNAVKDDKPVVFLKEDKDLTIEGFKKFHFLKADGIINRFQINIKDIVIFSDDDFKKEISTNLPVIARNKLENGESKNLWYEEVVPKKSIFYFGVITGQEYKDEFIEIITDEPVQIGANATIGYGYCDISCLEGDSNE